MINKKAMLIILLVGLLSISIVSASENVTDNLNVQNTQLLGDNSSTGSFTDLNDAINSNSDADIYLHTNYTYNSSTDSNFQWGIDIEREVTIHGNGFTIDANGEASIFRAWDNVIFRDIVFINGNSSSDGGAVLRGTSINCTFINNYAGDCGGAIYCGNAEDCTFISNSAFLNSGAVYGNAKNCIFIGNSAMYGGAMYGENYVAYNCTFINNTASQKGGATYGVKVKMSTFTSNSANYGGAMDAGNAFMCNFSSNSARYYGGATHDTYVVGSIFEHNEAKYGGALCGSRAYNCTFTDNHANSEGGAVYSAEVSRDSLFSNNSPNDIFMTTFFEPARTFTELNIAINAGNSTEIHLDSNYAYNQVLDEDFKDGIPINRPVTINGHGVTISGDNQVILFNVSVPGVIFKDFNFANATYGVYGNATVEDSLFLNIPGYCLVESTAVNCNFTGDRAISKGKAINCTFTGDSKNYYYVLYQSDAVNCIFRDNSAGAMYGGNAVNCTFIGNSADYGGALTTTSATNCTFINNSASYVGGAIYRGNAVNCIFINNSAVECGGAVNAYGYAVSNCTFISNNAGEGGAVYGADVIGCVFTNNTAVSGGAALDSAVINSTFEYNSAVNGGAVCGGLVKNCTFAYNSASENGGAVLNSTVSRNSKFDKNTPQDTYDVIFFDVSNAKTFTELNSTINGNSNSEIYLDCDYAYDVLSDSNFQDGITIARPVTIYGNGFSINGLTMARIFKVSSENITFKNLTFKMGKTTEMGGAIEGDSTAINCTFTQNVAFSAGAMDGGSAINCTFISNRASYVAGAAAGVSLESCVFINNSAVTGGAIANSPAVNCNFTNNHASSGGAMSGQYAINCTFTQNAADWGGAIYSAMVAINCVFINNSAQGESGCGGALSGCDAMGCTFIANTAGRDGGAIIYGDASTSTFRDNRAARFGGAMYGDDYTAFESTFENNSAIYGGAIYKTVAVGCSFENNSASSFGGAAYGSVVINSTFTYNSANKGGAVNGRRVLNCTFEHNSASECGGAVKDAEVSTNTKFKDNHAKIGNDTYNVEFFNAVPAKTFTDLNNLINSNNDTDIYLDGNYTYNIDWDSNYVTGVKITRQVTIHGNGFTLDGGDLARIFRVNTIEDVVFKDIVFKNGYATDDSIYDSFVGGAISGDSMAINCTFISNSARKDGGATNRVDVINCTFINNSADKGGAVSGLDLVINCTFINNTALTATSVKGLLRFSDCTLVENCTFINTQSINRDAVVDVNEVNSTYVNLEDPAPKYVLTVSNLASIYSKKDKLVYRFTTTEGDIMVGATIRFDIYNDNGDNYNIVERYYVTVSDECIVDLDAGEYDVVATATQYRIDSVNATISIARMPSNISLEVEDCIIGEHVMFRLLSNVTSEVSLWLDTENKRVNLDAGKVTIIDMGACGAGVHYVSAEVYGENFIESIVDKYMTVYDKIDGENIFISDFDYGQTDVPVTNFPGDACGNITLTIDGIDYPGEVIGGEVKVIADLDAGNYSYVLNYFGDDTYAQSIFSGNFTVNKVNSSVELSDMTFDYGSIGEGNFVLNGADSITANVDGSTDNITVKEGVIEVYGLDVGLYTLTVTTVPDRNHNAVSVNVTVTVNKAIPVIDFEVSDISCGADEIINFTSDVGSVEIYLDDVLCDTVLLVNGTGTKVFAKPDVGIHTVEIRNVMDSNYEQVSIKKTFNVSKLTPALNFEVEDIVYGGIVLINVTCDVDCLADLNLNNDSYSSYVTDSRTTFNLGILDAGDYEFNISISPGQNFENITKTGNFKVMKAYPNLNAEAGNIEVGDVLSVNVAFNGESDITLTIANETYVNHDCVLSTVFNISNLKEGSYTLNVTCAENKNYFADSKVFMVSVSKKSPQMSIDIYESAYGENATVIVSVDGTGSVVLAIGGSNYTSEIVGGSASFGIAGLSAGTYDFEVFYSGDGTYESGYSSASLTVVKAAGIVSVNVDDITVGEVAFIVVNASGSGSVMLDVDGANYTKNLVDGQAVFEVSGLDAGTYIVNVYYSGNGNYEPASASNSFVVNEIGKLNSTVIVSADDVTYGENATVVVGVDGTGSVILTVGNSTFEENVTNGKAVFRIPGLDAGIHDLKLTYSGDDQYLGNSTMKTLTVLKANPDLSVAADSIVVGETLTVNVVFNDISDITLTIANQTFTNYNCMLSTAFNISELKAGSYTLNVTYGESRNYLADSKAVIVFVNKKISQISIDADDITYGENATVIVSVDGTGSVVLAIGGSNYTSDVVNGYAAFEIAGLDAGTYYFDVFYSGDETYDSATASAILTVIKAAGLVAVDVDDITVGEVAVIVVNASGSGSVILDVDSANYTKALVDGQAVFEVSGLDVGTYVVTVNYSGDINYEPNTASNSFVVNEKGKLNSTIAVSADDITYGETVTVIVSVNGTGSVILTVGDSAFEENVVGEQAIFRISDLNAGSYDLKVTYSGDDQYLGNSAKGTLTVLKANPKISIQTQDVSYGQPLTVYVKANGSGNVILDINNKRYTNKSIENVAVFVIENLTAGQYLINANYMGDGNYLDANSSYTVNVNQISSNMAVNLNDISYGETLTVNVNLEGSGIVELNIGGNNYHATVNDGTAQFNITGLDAGSYDVNVVYQGDTNHKSDSFNKTVNVLKIAPSIHINSSDIDEGQTAVITVNVDGEGSVDLQINGEIYAEELKNNVAVFEIPNLTAGTYIANAAYSGDKNHLNATAATGFTVNSIEKANSTITVSQANFTYGENATITVEVEGTGNVTLTIANKTLVNDLTNHVTSFKLSGLDAGEYNAKLIYSGDDAYNGASKNIIVTVKKADPTLKVDVSDINYGENLNIKASLNAEGDVVAVLNNKSYSSKTHNGIAEFDVTGLDAGEYLIKLSYSGGKNYNDASVEKQISVFKINSSIEVAAEDINYGESAVIIVNAEGTGTVDIKILNDSYTGQIENGIVKFNVSNLNAGTYEFDITYSGDINHNGNAAKDRLNVLKATPSVNVTVYNVSYGNVVVTVDVNAEGIVELTVANRSLKGTVESGKVSFNISDLSAGHYDVVARYLGDVNHNEKSSSSGFDVDKVTVTISHEVQNDTVAVILPGDATGTVTLIINNQSEISNVIGGIANIMIPDLENGNYTYVISYSGNEKYFSAISNGSLVINKSGTVTPEIVIPPLDILSEGAVSLPEDATGNITLSVAGEIYVFPVVNGVANVSMPDLANGNYSYVISYSGDGKYSSFAQNGSVSVLKANPNLEVSVSDIDFGEIAVVNIFINENVTGPVLVNGKTVSIVNGKASLNLSGLAAGNHTVNVTFAGDRRFVSDSKAVSFRVNKLAAVIAIDVLDSVVEGSDLTVNVAVPGATGVVVINGRQYALVNGAANVTFSNVEEGSFAIDVGYAGDDVYMGAHTSKVVTVYAKKDAGITANDVKINVGDVAVIDIAVNRNITGKITVNGDEVEVVGGTAKYAVAGLAFGNYTYVIKFAGDKYFNADEKTVKITVNKIETPAGENPFDVDDNKTVESKTPTYSISLPADATGTLTVTIGDNIYTADVVNGTATVVITDMPAGNYEVKLTYSGDEKYSAIVKTTKATVKVNPRIVANDATVQYYAGKYYSVTVYGDDGKVAAGTPVTFTLNGKKLTTVNTASNGVAKFKVTQTPVTKGNLEVSALKVSVTKKLTIQRVIVLKKVAVKKSAKKIYLTATLKKVNGKYLKNKKITFKFKGKKVGTVKTNSKGVAKILLKTSFYKNLKKGSKVTYTATYVKDTVKQTVKIKK